MSPMNITDEKTDLQYSILRNYSRIFSFVTIVLTIIVLRTLNFMQTAIIGV